MKIWILQYKGDKFPVPADLSNPIQVQYVLDKVRQKLYKSVPAVPVEEIIAYLQDKLEAFSSEDIDRAVVAQEQAKQARYEKAGESQKWLHSQARPRYGSNYSAGKAFAWHEID